MVQRLEQPTVVGRGGPGGSAVLRSREARSALKRIPLSQRFKRQKNAVVVPGQKKTTQCNASVNARRVGRSAYFGRTVWVALLQTQMAGTVSPKMKRSPGKKKEGGSGLSPSEHQRIALRNGAPTGAKGSSLSSGGTLP
jgi:hypothetical protein